MSVYEKIKKYLFILSIFFGIVISVHAVVLYLYSDSQVSPQEGGSINVGMLGDIATLNPAKYLMDSSNDFMLQFLYRSMIRYNIHTKQLEGDLASCDLSKNYASIDCTLRTDAYWKDGTRITRDDIFATYTFLKNSDENPGLKKLLSDIDVNEKGDTLTFSAKNADALVLDSLMVPIIKASDVEKIKNNTFDPKKMITSGAYEYVSTEIDSQTAAKKIVLQKNTQNPDPTVFIGKYNFKFFPDKKTLLKYEDSLGIIYTPNDNSEVPRSPRFNAYNFLLPQYVSLFLNSERLSLNLRKFLLSNIDTFKYPTLNTNLKKFIQSPFFGSGKILPDAKNINIANTLKELGFYKKDALGQILTTKMETAIKTQTAENFGYNFYFKTPTTKQVYFTDKKEILVSGNVPAGVTNVWINDYKLKSFIAGNTKFYFKANVDLKTLKDGQNIYTLYFEITGKKIRKETLTVYRSDDANWLTQKETALKTISIEGTKKNQSLLVLQNEKEKNAQKLAALNPSYYYDVTFSPFTLTLDYSNQPDTVEIGQTIAKDLRSIGVQVAEKVVTGPDLQDMITKGDKNYDILITGINLGLLDYNIAPFFHSGQAKIGFNFSKLKNLQLDILLEDIKSRQLPPDKLNASKAQILDILKNEAVMKTFYSPYSTIYLDKNLKNTTLVENIPYAYYFFDGIKNSYIKESRTMNSTNKTIPGFILWLSGFLL